MKKKTIIWIAVIVVGVLIFGGYPLYVYNYCSTTEVDVLYYQNECKNGLSEALTQVKGSDQVLTREEKNRLESMRIAVSRYDKMEDALAYFVQEQNLAVSSESYQQVRQTLQIYYSKFYAKQTSLNDMARAYKHKRATALFGLVSGWFGFPTKDYTDARVDQLILEKGVNETYDSKDRTMPDIPMSLGDTTK